MSDPQHDPAGADAGPVGCPAVPLAAVLPAQSPAAVAPRVACDGEPTLVWSYSQQTRFETCPRATYFATELAPQGWRTDATEVARTAMRLRTLTALDLAVGNALHDRATECASAIRDGEPLPPLRHLRQRASAFVRYVWVSSLQRYDQWLTHPRNVPMLMERYYGRGPSPERGARARERMERGLVALHDLGLWEEAAACDPASIRTPSKLTKYTLPDPRGLAPVLVWAVPDLLLRLPNGGPWVVVDVKTGRVAGRPTDQGGSPYQRARRQVESYAVYLRHGLGVLGPDEGCQGRLAVLSDGTEDEWWISAADIDAAEARIREGARRLAAARARADEAEHAVLAGAEGQGLGDEARASLVQLVRRGTYPITHDPVACHHCPYLELCAPEQGRVVGGSAGAPSEQEVA